MGSLIFDVAASSPTYCVSPFCVCACMLWNTAAIDAPSKIKNSRIRALIGHDNGQNGDERNYRWHVRATHMEASALMEKNFTTKDIKTLQLRS